MCRSSKKIPGLLACLLLVLSALPAGAELSEGERQLVAAIDAGVPEALSLLRRAVDINSGTMNFEGVREVGRLFQPQFEDLGFAVRWDRNPGT